MLRFVARRMPRFRLSTLCASMLLFVTLAGVWRNGSRPDVKENEALLALRNEKLGYQAFRASGISAREVPRESLPWNPMQRLADWIVGNSDRIERIQVRGWPTDETRAKLFDLPHLKTLELRPAYAPAPEDGPNGIPLPDEILGRSLPKLPDSKAVPDEPPPLPQGTPLSEEERVAVASDMQERWKSAPEFPAKKLLCHGFHSDFDDYSFVIAVEGTSVWQLLYEDGPRERVASSTLRTDDCFVQRQRNVDGWQTRAASRDRGFYSSPSPYELLAQAPYLDMSMDPFFEGDPGSLYESAERLEDGALLLRMRPRQVRGTSFGSDPSDLVRGALIVDPAHDFAVRRIEGYLEGKTGPRTFSFRRAFEYEEVGGLYLPARCQTWVELPPGGSFGGKSRHELRYAWEVDPELPADLFSPTRGGAEFLPPRPVTFQWWYVTGAISLGWFYMIASDRVRRRFRRSASDEAAAEADPITFADRAAAE